jgi:predicted RNA methylase
MPDKHGEQLPTQLALFSYIPRPHFRAADSNDTSVERLAASGDERGAVDGTANEWRGSCAHEVRSGGETSSPRDCGAPGSERHPNPSTNSATSAIEVVANPEPTPSTTTILDVLMHGLEMEVRRVGKDVARLEALETSLANPPPPLDLRDVDGKINCTGLTWDDFLRITHCDDTPLMRAMWAADYDAIEVMHVLRGALPNKLPTTPPPHIAVSSPPFPSNTIGAIILPHIPLANVMHSTSSAPTPRPCRASRVRSGPNSAAPSRANDEPPTIAMRRITDRQRELLGQLVVADGRAVFGSDDHIDDWAALKEVVKLLGGKWKSGGKGVGGKRGGFVFDKDIDVAETIWLARERGEVFDPKLAGFFATSAPVADDLVSKVPLDAHARVLEPNAGTGDIVRAILRAYPTALVWCAELLENHRRTLAIAGYPIIGADFLELNPSTIEPFDAAIMNPPFGNSGDAKHVLHAIRFIRPAGHLAAIISPGIQHRSTAPYFALRRWVERHGGGMKEIPAGAFADAGTNVRTIMIWGATCNQCASGACVTT